MAGETIPLEEIECQASTQRDNLIACVADAEYWHDPDRTAYATISVGDHREHYPIRSRAFRDWLGYIYYKTSRSAPSAQATEEALRIIEAQAKYDGQEHEPAVRVGEHDDEIYLDLGNETWGAVEITAAGWRVVADPPVRFVRPKGMRPLPLPVAGGSINGLKEFINVASDDDFMMLAAWLVMALKPRGPYPILVLNGEQGAAKSTAARVLRGLVDPNAAALRAPPREERDLLIAARNSWCVSLDNLSRVTEWQADALCRLATGGGYSARQLYSDAEEIIFEAMRPIILNGIPDLATRPDMASRAVVMNMPFIPEDIKLSEQLFWERFNRAAGSILGALLDAVSYALGHQDGMALDSLPRMADFCLWIEAASPALGWPAGSFINAYRRNIEAAIRITVDADLVADAIRGLIAAAGHWEGIATELLAELERRVSDNIRRAKEWPKAANVLSGRLRLAAPGLREVGIDVSIKRSKGQTRFTLAGMQNVGEKDRHHRNPGSTESEKQREINRLLGGDGGGDRGGDWCDPCRRTAPPPVVAKSLLNNDFPGKGGDGCDGGDDFPSHSVPMVEEGEV